MKRHSGVVSAKFCREPFSNLEITMRGLSTVISLWYDNIDYYARVLSEKELEESIAILSQHKEVMLEERNFSPIYEDMLSDLMDAQIARYGVKRSDRVITPWRCMVIHDVEKMFEQNFNIKDVHIHSCNFSCNPDNGRWTDLTMNLKFRDIDKRGGDK